MTHITALCPFCGSTYQVHATLRGQWVRCPNAACRKVFSVPLKVPETGPSVSSPLPQPTPPPSNSQLSGVVGELVPMLPTEQVIPPQEASAARPISETLPAASVKEEQPVEQDWRQATAPSSPLEEPPKDAVWWRDAPPVRKPQGSSETNKVSVSSSSSAPPTRRLRRPPPSPTQTQAMPAFSSEEPEPPRELPPGTWEPPPVRRQAKDPEQAVHAVEEPAAEQAQAETDAETETQMQPRLNKRLVRLSILVLFLLTFGILSSVGLWVWRKLQLSEEELSAAAREDYKQGSFRNAQSKYEDLAKRFPSSDHAGEYRFLADWCAVCREVADPDANLSAAAAHFDQFVQDHKKDPLMVQFSSDAGQHLLHLAQVLAARNVHPSDESPLEVVQRIEQLQHRVTTLRADALSPKDAKQIEAYLEKIRQAVESLRKRRRVLAQLRKQDTETPMEAIKRSRSLLARMERELPGISRDAEATEALVRLEEEHLASVVYYPATEVSLPPPSSPGEEAEVLVFAPLLPSAAPGVAPTNDGIVQALARGVLYVLKQSNGEPKWATPVGIDTTVLPLRVPASAFSPELLLVLSADTQTLSALNVQGDLQWEYYIGQPVLGRPILFEHRIYLPDYSGWVHEIELSRGQLLGRWYLGQPLTCGGAREGNTSRLYFPAEDSCIYVLDVNPQSRRCVTILYDDHPSGSLRSEPVLIPPQGETAPGYLILNQASGLDTMELRVFELPIQDRHAAPLPLDPPARFAGWTWFEPKTDGEKLAVLSDAGVLGLFGIRQRGNQDPPLFPWLPTAGLDLSPFLLPPTLAKQELTQKGESSPERSRAQLVHMQGNDLWVLAHGRLQQLHLRLDPAQGPQIVPRWPTALPIGSPLHEPQRLEGADGRFTFFLVTQALEQQTCLATAVSEEGLIRWQRQLGLVCRSEPLALTPPAGGPPLLLVLDQGGGLFVLDPMQPTKPHFLAPALAENPRIPPRLLPASDGRSCYEIAAPGDGQWFIVRHIEWMGDQRQLRFREAKVSRASAVSQGRTPAGLPVVTHSQLLVPMADGNIAGVPLDDLFTQEQPLLRPGPGWRDVQTPVSGPLAQTPVSAPTIVPLGGDRFLTTNGNRRLSVYEWPPGPDKVWQFLPRGGEPLTLEHLVAAPPVLVPSRDNLLSRVAVVDSAGVLRLFTVTSDGALQPGRSWELNGNLTAGPFVQAVPEGGWRIGCVLDRHRLLWIDPDKAEPLWSYSSDGPAILGQPQRIEDMLVVALQSGRYVGLDPNTGRPKGPGYTLRTSAAPAATPTAFGPGRMFAPLSDGTALLLSLEVLRTKKS